MLYDSLVVADLSIAFFFHVFSFFGGYDLGMVKFIHLMNSINVKAMPVPPSLMKALMAGFDAISNHLGLILFAILLDLAIWFGPRLRLDSLWQSIIARPMALSGLQGADILERMQTVFQGLNLLGALRTFPVGIPSLMVTRSPSSAPLGTPLDWQVPTVDIALLLWISFTLLGLAAGTLYFLVVSQAALLGKVTWRQSIQYWPRACLHVILLFCVWIALLALALVPMSCFLSILLFSGIGSGTGTALILIMFAVVLLWLFMPLIFSPHGIFAYHYSVFDSIRESIRLSRWTLPTTSLFLVILVVLSEGLDALWNVPTETSWFMLVGVAGHAFITTSLLAASFIYYNDAFAWVKRLLQETKMKTL